MKFDPNTHHRHSTRLRRQEYGDAGAYFVTVRTEGRVPLFGEVVNGKMVLNDAGRLVWDVWQGLPMRFPTVELDAFTVMPNHVHGIVVIVPGDSGTVKSEGAGLAPPKSIATLNKQPALGQIVGAFKSLSAIAVNRLLDRSGASLWQRNYHDRVIRNEEERVRVREYVCNNPKNWDLDAENPLAMSVRN